MSRTPPGDLTLINDNSSGGDSGRGAAAGFGAGRRAYPRKFSDAFDALEFGLPLSGAPVPERASLDPQSAGRSRATTPRAADVHVPLMAAALIISICAAIGGAAAVLVFHDRVMHITAARAANR
jgi:hypothetical protein